MSQTKSSRRTSTSLRAFMIAIPFFFLAGCGNLEWRQDTASPPEVKGGIKYDTQVAVGKCVFERTPEIAFTAVASALLSSVISQGVNRIGTALEEAAKDEEKGVLASRNVEVSSKSLKCIQVVRGWFFLDPASITKNEERAKVWHSSEFITSEKHRKLFQNQLWIAAPPDFIFEGAFDVASDKTALTIVPQYVRLDEPLFARRLRSERSRYVTLFFAFAKPEESLALPTNPAAALDLGKLEPGTPKDDYASVDALPPNAINRWPGETDWFQLQLAAEKQPLTIGAYVQEKQGASAHLKFVAEVFKGAKTDITSTLQTALVPQKRQAAQRAAWSAQEKAADAYDTAYVVALKKLEGCVAGGDTKTLAKDARSAMRGLNAAARAADESKVFGDGLFDAIQIKSAANVVQQACRKALSQI